MQSVLLGPLEKGYSEWSEYSMSRHTYMGQCDSYEERNLSYMHG